MYLACLPVHDAIIANAGKQAVPIINKRNFSRIALPCFNQQRMREISAAVDSLDDEHQASSAALSQLTALKASVMSDLLAGRVRMPA